MKIESTKTIVYYTKENIETIDNMIQILKVLAQNTVICEQYDATDIPNLAIGLETIRYDLFGTNFHSDLIELRLVPWEAPDSKRENEYADRDPLGDDYPF